MPTDQLPPLEAQPETGWAAVKQTWSDPDRWTAVVVATAPGVAFVAVNAGAGLRAALVAAGVVAVAGLGVRLTRRSPVRSALVGCLVVAVCAAVAALTGEARGFFLLPALVPFAVIATCLVTLVARRPLTGLLLNRVTGGPVRWYRDADLRRVHSRATWAAVLVNVANGTLQVVFYLRDDTAVLAVAHAATGPVFATLVAVTVVAVRRTLATRR